MKIKNISKIFAFIVLTSPAALTNQAFANFFTYFSHPKAARPTEIINTQAILPANQTAVSGSCFSGSIATSRQDAWRCSVGNMILDPCYQTAEDPNHLLICGLHPIDDASVENMQNVIVLKVDQLPVDKQNNSKDIKPWIIGLPNGQKCSAFTGTLTEVDGNTIDYGCSTAHYSTARKIYVGLSDVKSDDRGVWTAKELYYYIDTKKSSPTAVQLDHEEDVVIEKIWL